METQETIETPTVAAPDATPLPQPAPSRRGQKLLCSLAWFTVWTAAGLLLWLCYFPVACGWLGWVALVPTLFLVRSTARPRSVYCAAWVVGSAFFWTAISWMRVADDRMYATWAMLAVYCSLYFPVAVWLFRFLDRRTPLPLIVTVPVVWTALEFLRAHLMTGFAWYFLAHTQHDFLPAIQIADLGGAYAVSFVVAAVNALLFEWLYRSGRLRRCFSQREPAVLLKRRNLALQSAAVFALVTGTLLYGMWRLGQHEIPTGPLVALVQSNLDQRLRNAAAPGSSAAERMVIHNRELCDIATRHSPSAPDLIVWPESSYPEDWTEVSPDVPADQVPPEWRRQLAESRELGRLVASRWKTGVLLGMNAEVLGNDAKRSRYNSAVLIGGEGQSLGRYDKMHRVPFGEFVPLRDWLPWMNRFAPYDFDYSIRPGEQFTQFPINRHGTLSYRFGVIICYEDTDPVLACEYVRPGAEPPADFLVNISNDGWFNGSSEHEEHLAICRFRAVECRRAIARSVNMGISAVIDGNGNVLWPKSYYRRGLDGHAEFDCFYGKFGFTLGSPEHVGSRLGESEFVRRWEAEDQGPFRRFVAAYVPFLGPYLPSAPHPVIPVRDWHDFKQVAGVLWYTVPLDTRESLYARYGDWLPWGCWAVLGMGLVCGVVRRSSV